MKKLFKIITLIGIIAVLPTLVVSCGIERKPIVVKKDLSSYHNKYLGMHEGPVSDTKILEWFDEDNNCDAILNIDVTVESITDKGAIIKSNPKSLKYRGEIEVTFEIVHRSNL